MIFLKNSKIGEKVDNGNFNFFKFDFLNCIDKVIDFIIMLNFAFIIIWGIKFLITLFLEIIH